MKSLPLKLGIFIVVLFGLVILGFVLYEPLWWKWYEAKLQSDDKVEYEVAIERAAAKSAGAVPYLKKWIKSKNKRIAVGACKIIRKMKYPAWKEMIPEIEYALKRKLPDSIEMRLKTSVKSEALGIIEEKGREMIPCFKKWLLSGDYRLVEACCHVLSWRHKIPCDDILPELEQILDDPPSRIADEAAHVIVSRFIDWKKKYRNNRMRLINMYCYFINHYNHHRMMQYDMRGEDAVAYLSTVKNEYLYKYILLRIRQCSNEPKRDKYNNSPYPVSVWVRVLANYDDPRSTKELIDYLKYGKSGTACGNAVKALGIRGSQDALAALLRVVKNRDYFNKMPDEKMGFEFSFYYNPRLDAAEQLLRFSDSSMIEPLLEAVENETDPQLKAYRNRSRVSG